MTQFLQHLVSGKVVFVVQLNPGDEFFYGIELASKDLTPKTFPTSEYDEDEEPRFSDIALSFKKENSYAPNRARSEYYELIANNIKNLREPIHW